MPASLANLLLLLAGAIWGMGFVAQETAMDDMGPMLFIGLRFLLAGIVVLPLAIREQRRSTARFGFSQFRRLSIVGIAFFLGITLQQIGITGTTVTNAGFLTALYVVMVPLILFFALREPQSVIIWPAAALMIAGIFLLSAGEMGTFTWGDGFVISSAVFWALHVILTRKIGLASGTPVTMATLQFLICGGLGLSGHFLASHVFYTEPAASIPVIFEALPEILYAGIFAGAFAFTLQAVGQQYTSAAAAAILLSSESLFAALFGAIFLAERLAMSGYLGCGMIFSAILIVELRSAFSRRRAPVS